MFISQQRNVLQRPPNNVYPKEYKGVEQSTGYLVPKEKNQLIRSKSYLNPLGESPLEETHENRENMGNF